ncbi:hypothetical protein Leryth_023188 [Lithospermum erythrorhizon]|nr:hypothetical protein Leryth_023188 [Lithospermum erythrorhizon]
MLPSVLQLWISSPQVNVNFFFESPMISKVYVFKGSKEVTKDQVLEQMGFFVNKPKPATGVIAGARDGLSQESISSGSKSSQVHWYSIDVAMFDQNCVFQALVQDHPLREALGGPATEGPGSVGLAELKVAIERSGGFVVLAESFGHSIFKDSLKHVFHSGEHDLALSSKRTLIQLDICDSIDTCCSRLETIQKSSITTSPRLSMTTTQFIYHLNSTVVQVFNNSPDETAFFRMILNRENVANSVVMIQPSLISYSFHSTPEPALLDVAAIAADRILLLDSYFTIVVFHGSTVAQWRKDGYHELEEHKVFAELLQAPRDDADAIIRERFPVPRLVICDQYGSQARFLLAKLNPSATYNSDSQLVPGGDIIFTDDVSFEVFLEHLQRLAVQ